MLHPTRDLPALAVLFMVLLDGCATDDPCAGFVPEEKIESVPLSAAEYASWQAGGMGMVMGSTGEASTGEASTGSGTTGGMTTGGVTTGGVTTGGMTLSDSDICSMVCLQYSDFPESCAIEPGEGGGKVVSCTFMTFCMVGRGHAGVRSCRPERALGAGAWLAAAAHDEAASVHAFTALARELAEHGAPRSLVDALVDAAADEVRHAARVGALARQFGGEPPPVEFAAPPVRALVELAVENAVEGCVNETWSALVTAHQGRFADEPERRRCFAEIAADEARHAELAWTIDAWLRERLDPGERARVDAARLAAVRRLAAEIDDVAPDAWARRSLGLPSPVLARRLCASMDAALWSRAA